MERYESLLARHEGITARLTGLKAEKRERSARRENLSRFLEVLRQRDGFMTEFDEGLWCILVESVTVTPESEALFRFKDGREVRVSM